MTVVKSKLKYSFAFVVALLGASFAAPLPEYARAQTSAPFAGLAGKWAGEGSIVLASGTTERLRCDATYAVSGGGEDLDQTLRCKSDSYDFDIRINLTDSGGQVVGNWNEVTKGVTGGISGQDSNGLIQATVSGQALYANVTVATHGNEQSVKIHSDSGNLQKVTITLRRTH